MNIEPFELTDAIKEILETASSDLKKELNGLTEKVAAEGVKNLKKSSPVYKGKKKLKYDPGTYAKSWTYANDYSKVTGNGSCTIYNKYHYRLTHLLEFGHVNRDGSRTKAFPHIAAVNEQVCKKFEEKVEAAISEM